MAKRLAPGSSSGGWSDWADVPGFALRSSAVLAEIVDGGQAFRWYRSAEQTWIGAWGQSVSEVRIAPHGQLQWRAPAEIAPRVASSLPDYFASATDFAACADQLPWRSDRHLADCIAAFQGLRILRQPLGETLLCFLCSATKQIVQIKQMVALLAKRHGERVGTFAGARALDGTTRPTDASTRDEDASVLTPVYALPTWDKLAKVPETELRACLLGFRARYIAETARYLAAHPGWLDETETMPYPAAKERLCSLPGVGEKVADCVLLFGAGRLEAFPVDVWILKTMARRYGLEGWKPAQLTQFGHVHFGANAGLAQQYLFAWERKAGRETKERAT